MIIITLQMKKNACSRHNVVLKTSSLKEYFPGIFSTLTFRCSLRLDKLSVCISRNGIMENRLQNSFLLVSHKVT